MPRLIDADMVKRAFIGNRYGTKAIEYVIDDVPTVKAISVEWIKKYAKKGGRIANILFPFEIEMMLEDWEKENAKID